MSGSSSADGVVVSAVTEAHAIRNISNGASTCRIGPDVVALNVIAV